MKFSLLICSIFLFSCGYLSAQLDLEINLIGDGDMAPYKNSRGFDLRYEGVRGTPLLFDDWQTAQIQLINQDSFSNLTKMNVDLNLQVMVIQMRDGSTGQVNISRIKSFKTISPDNQINTWQILPEKEIEGTDNPQLKCYHILHAGKITFVKAVNKKLLKASYKEAYSIGNRYDEYIKDVEYWISADEKPYQKIKLKQKSLEEALPRQAARIARTLKTQKLSAGDEKDIIQLLQILEKDA